MMPDRPAAIEREKLQVETLEDLWCWLNTWGNRDDRTAHGSLSRKGYEMAMADVLHELENAGVTFADVSKEAWRRWSRAK